MVREPTPRWVLIARLAALTLVVMHVAVYRVPLPAAVVAVAPDLTLIANGTLTFVVLGWAVRASGPLERVGWLALLTTVGAGTLVYALDPISDTDPFSVGFL
ncbi:MAG: hypothetical protein D6683_15385, partial [Actinomyces sp.]